MTYELGLVLFAVIVVALVADLLSGATAAKNTVIALGIVVIGCLLITLVHFGEDTMRRETATPKIARAAR